MITHFAGCGVEICALAATRATASHIFGMLYVRPADKWQHYVGALLSLTACTVQVVPSFNSSSGTVVSGTYILWLIIMALSAVPAALSNVYKEAKIKV